MPRLPDNERIPCEVFWEFIRPYYHEGVAGYKGQGGGLPASLNGYDYPTKDNDNDLIKRLKRGVQKTISADRAEQIISRVDLDPTLVDALLLQN